MQTPSYIRTHYRDYLSNALAGRGGLQPHQVNAVLTKYDTAVGKGHPVQQAFAELLESFGNEDVPTACNLLRSQLEKLNQSHEGVDVNPVTKLRAYLDRHRANISKCAAEIKDDRGHTKVINGEPEQVKDPAFLPPRSQTYQHTATAHYSGKTAQLDITITI